jgi:hypothetical protein
MSWSIEFSVYLDLLRKASPVTVVKTELCHKAIISLTPLSLSAVHRHISHSPRFNDQTQGSRSTASSVQCHTKCFLQHDQLPTAANASNRLSLIHSLLSQHTNQIKHGLDSPRSHLAVRSVLKTMKCPCCQVTLDQSRKVITLKITRTFATSLGTVTSLSTRAQG